MAENIQMAMAHQLGRCAELFLQLLKTPQIFEALSREMTNEIRTAMAHQLGGCNELFLRFLDNPNVLQAISRETAAEIRMVCDINGHLLTQLAREPKPEA
jgi:hypothetical protein